MYFYPYDPFSDLIGEIIAFLLCHIVVLDCIIFSVFSTSIIKFTLLKEDIHTVFVILIFLAIFLIMYLISRTRVGYWIISFVFTLFGSLFFGGIVYHVTDEDKIWMWFARVVIFLILGALHLYSIDRD